MRVLQVHNIYIGKTGEEAVVNEEKRVLEKNNHEVIQFIRNSSDLKDFSTLARLKVFVSLHSSKSTALELAKVIDDEKPDICHVHNTFPLITPVVYQVCKSKGIPVVQTLHNYKMVCTNSLLFRDGKVCEECLNKNLFHSVKFKCYRDSYVATAVQASVLQFHRRKGTWDQSIDKYICLTEFQKDKLVSGGVLENKIVVKPNFLSEHKADIRYDDFFLFVGRINDSKGFQDLIHLFEKNQNSQFILIGKADQPEKLQKYKNVKHLGEQDREVVLQYMRNCKAVLFPSKYYEGMPIVILEAFSHKKPIVSRNVGAMSSMIEHGVNGIKYNTEQEFVEAVTMLQNDLKLVLQLGEGAFNDYSNKYTDTIGYDNLIKVYSSVLNN